LLPVAALSIIWAREAILRIVKILAVLIGGPLLGAFFAGSIALSFVPRHRPEAAAVVVWGMLLGAAVGAGFSIMAVIYILWKDARSKPSAVGR
jgi:hypothetical protein